MDAWLVPINPLPPGLLRRAVEVKYLRTSPTQLTYWPLLLRELRRADVVHVFSASYFSFLLAPLPAVAVAKLLGQAGRDELPQRRSARPSPALGDRARRRLRCGRARTPCRRGSSRTSSPASASASEIIPNIVDVERFRVPDRGPLRPRVLSTRNFEPLYNVACTLRAFRLVQDRYPDAR